MITETAIPGLPRIHFDGRRMRGRIYSFAVNFKRRTGADAPHPDIIRRPVSPSKSIGIP